MAFWLRSEERRVAARGRRVRADLSMLQEARRSLAAGIRHELGRPKALLACFAAGLGYGWLRKGTVRPAARREDADVAEHTGRLAKLTAAVIAGARIYDQLKSTAAFVERYGYSDPAVPTSPGSGSTAPHSHASGEPPQRERAQPGARASGADQDAFSCS